MKKILAMLCALVMLLGAVSAVAEELTPGSVLGATIFTNTFDEGEKVIGIRVEYSGEVAAGAATIDTYDVLGYDVIGTFVNNDGAWGNSDPAGRYVFVMLEVDSLPSSNLGKTTLYSSATGTVRVIPQIDIRQVATLTMADGAEVAPIAFTTNGQLNNIIADKFIAGEYTDEAGNVLPYRLYIPEGYETKSENLENLPVVMFLHGSGEKVMIDNYGVQILANPSGTSFATPEAQEEHPCFVFVPQTVAPYAWAASEEVNGETVYGTGPMLEAAISMLKTIIADYNVDANRVYCTGLSMGSRGTYVATMKYPELFAAALNLCSADIYSDEQIAALEGMPIWIILSGDEREDRITQMGAVKDQLAAQGRIVCEYTGDKAWNGYLRGYEAEKQAEAQIAEAAEMGADVLFTHYTPYTVITDPHSSWMATYTNAAVREWLFSQSK